MVRAILPESWPIPALSKFNRDFFTSGTLVVQECAECGNIQHPPEEICHKCLGMDFKSRQTNGRGTIYSYMVIHHPAAPELQKYVPYAVVLVSLDEHPHCRILGNVLNRKPEEISIGQKVRVTFEEIADGDEKILMPQWEAVD